MWLYCLVSKCTLSSSSRLTLQITGIRSCLLGAEMRFDGGHKRDAYATGTLARYFEFVPVCPEVAIGLSTPREPIRLVRIGEASDPVLTLPLTKGSVASYLGTVHETLSRTFARLIRDEVIAVDGPQITIRDKKKLERLV